MSCRLYLLSYWSVRNPTVKKGLALFDTVFYSHLQEVVMCYSLLIINEVYMQHVHIKAVIHGVMLAATREGRGCYCCRVVEHSPPPFLSSFPLKTLL